MSTQKIKMSELRNLVRETINEEKKKSEQKKNVNESKQKNKSKQIDLNEFKSVVKNLIREELNRKDS